MPAEVSVVSTIQAGIENVQRKNVTLYPDMGFESPIVSKFKRAEAITINRHLWRQELKTMPGGSHAKMSLNNGIFPVGSGPESVAISGGYVSSAMAFQFNLEQLEAFDKSPQSVRRVVNDMIATSMARWAEVQEVEIFGDGTGILTSPCTAVSGGNTLTFGSATDTRRLHLIDIGSTVDVWPTGFAAPRAWTGGESHPRVRSVDLGTLSLTLDKTITGLAIGDSLTFAGLANYGPATPTSYAAGYPGTPGNVSFANGIGADSWRHGLPYFLNTNPANYYLGLQRGLYPYLIPTTVNAASAALDMGHFLRAFAKIHQKYRRTNWKNKFAVMSEAQALAIVQAGVSATNFMIQGDSFGRTKTLLPNDLGLEDTFELTPGLTAYRHSRMDNDVVWIVDDQYLGRAVLMEPQFWTGHDGLMFRPVMSNVNSNPRYTTAMEYWLVGAYDYWSMSMGESVVVSALQVPAGYDV